MAAPLKKRDYDCNDKHVNNQKNNSNSSDEESENDISNEQKLEVQVDFEGRNPEDPDFHGIKTLLKQLFLKAHVDIGNLTDLIISQNYIGSVIKQSQDNEVYDEEDDDNMNDVFGITTVVNITDRQNIPCIQQLRDLLKQLANEYATDSTNAVIKNLLENNSDTLALLINERFVNIPAQVSVPLFENLISEMRRAVNKNMSFNFSYYILICKLYKTKEQEIKHKSRESNQSFDLIWSNPEEELFADEAECSFEFCVEKESDTGMSGTWEEDDDEMIPYRRVLLIEASKLLHILDKVKASL